MLTESKKSSNITSIQTVQNIIDYIESNLLEILTLNNLAEHFYMNASTLNNLFKLVCSITIMEYIRNRRLSLAGKELIISDIHIIDLAFKYGYETPEAFTKAFTRFHGFPPSFLRRTYVAAKMFNSIKIKLEITGGWENETNDSKLSLLTKQNCSEQEKKLLYCYHEPIKYKGGVPMENTRYEYNLSLKDMKQKESWTALLSLAKKLDQDNIKFKVDGKTMIFAHGLEFELDKIGLTFKWKEEPIIKAFFRYEGKVKSSFKGFKYFDVIFEGVKVRCMFYGDCLHDDTDAFLFRNTEPVNIDGQILQVQTLEFYYNNSDPNTEYYKMVEKWISNIN